MQLAALAALLTGCNLIFQAEPSPLDGPAGELDAPDAVPDAAPCPAGTSPMTIRGTTLADAVLIDPRGAGTSQAFGKVPTTYLNYGSSIKSVGIWRFALPDMSVPPATWRAARVVLAWLPADDDCGPPSCAPCNAFEEAGTFELYPIRASWDEQVVSWTARSPGVPWNEPGAAGTDRGPFAASAAHVPRESLVLALDLAAITPWVAGDQLLSVVVVPKANPDGVSGARMIVPALPPRTSCAPPSPPSFLEVDACVAP